ncbi:MAG: aspartate/glutamate racemase family protein [Pseudomonadota bacterium]
MLSSDRHAAEGEIEQAQNRRAPVGIIMLDTQFPRIKGDIGSPESYAEAPLFKVAKGVRVSDIVRPERASEDSINALFEAARSLTSQGAVALATSCGFLHGLQNELTAVAGVPVAASSLSLTTRLAQRRYKIGLLTADAPALTPALRGIKVPFLVEGLETSEAFASAILADGKTLDRDQIEEDAVSSAMRAQSRGATCILLECTNLPPYRTAIEEATGLPVFDIFDALESVSGLRVRA